MDNQSSDDLHPFPSCHEETRFCPKCDRECNGTIAHQPPTKGIWFCCSCGMSSPDHNLNHKDSTVSIPNLQGMTYILNTSRLIKLMELTARATGGENLLDLTHELRSIFYRGTMNQKQALQLLRYCKKLALSKSEETYKRYRAQLEID